MVEIESCFLQLSISIIDSNCTRCNTLGIAPDPNPFFCFLCANSKFLCASFCFKRFEEKKINIKFNNIDNMNFGIGMKKFFFFLWFMIWDKGIWSFYFVPLRMCLVEWILGRMEKKIRRETFLEGVWPEGKEGKEEWSPSVFSLYPLESFLPKIRRKLWEEFDLFIDQNAQVHLHMG